MRSVFTILLMVIVVRSMAQTNTISAGIYSESGKVQKLGVVEKRQVLKGSTLDLKAFDIYTLTLAPGKTYTPPAADSKFEQLLVIKSGKVKFLLNDSAKVVGPGSIALILAGDKAAFQNISSEPASWFVINYESTNPVNIQRGYDAGPSFIKDWELLKVNKSVKGETRAVFDRATTMFGRFDVHATALNPGYASHDPHTHRVEELILMLKGGVQELIGTEEFMAKAGDCIYLSSGILHGPKNIGDIQCGYFAIQWHNLKTD